MALVEAFVTRASGAFEYVCARRPARNRHSLPSPKALMSSGVQLTGTLNYGAGKDVVKRGLNGICVEGENAGRNLSFARSVRDGLWSRDVDRLENLRIVPEEAGNLGVRFCIPEIFQEHGRRTWISSLGYRRFGVG